MLTGWFFACLAGFGMPGWVFLMGDIIDAFNPTSTLEEMLDSINFVSIVNLLIGVGVMITTYCYYASLLVFSESVANKTRIRYLEAIL
mmetsp:Transcript_43686/g.42204  ORF Transcript_43686/g.42204 Transcript_43686/m.42204 type:complete len:88 (+) Transcript_43686:201-464(+)